ncbi:serine--tRNA ligase [Candidatus Uhrbacteria bacterium]|nr:serine--tRNA ligase [Candidatus Uhrbacteria bacterium]
MDVKYLQQNPDKVRRNNEKRFKDIDIDETLALVDEQLEIIKEVEVLRAAANDIASSIPNVSNDEKSELIAKGKELKEQVKEKEESLGSIERRLNDLLSTFPNILKDDVPEGADETSNIIERTVGTPPVFDFPVKDHIEIGEALGLIDTERATKTSGARFAFLTGDAVLLEFALIQYTLSILTSEGFTPVIPPHMVSTKAMSAMGYLQRGGEEEIYHLKNDDLVLIGTSEQALGPMYMDEILDPADLPIRLAGFSPCYRREAGSYGRDVKGILRVHQFDKIEMFSFTDPDESDKEHSFLLSMQERLMEGLELPYRVVKLAAGDTGSPSARTWDIETWIPSQDQYRETHSTSNTTDYQTRRLQTRIRRDGKNEFAHALNGTAFAIGRILIALLENNQQADGSVLIPEPLRPFMGGRDRIQAN